MLRATAVHWVPAFTGMTREGDNTPNKVALS